MELGKYDASEDLLEDLLQENDECTDTLYLLGVCCSLQQDHIAAVDLLQRALQVAKQNNEDKAFQKEIQEELKKECELAEKQEQEERQHGDAEKQQEEEEEEEDDDDEEGGGDDNEDEQMK